MDLEALVWLLAVIGLGAYTTFVGVMVIRADVYSTRQKIMQCALAGLFPLVGAVVVHWFLRLHDAKPGRPDRAFIPEERPNIDHLRGLH